MTKILKLQVPDAGCPVIWRSDLIAANTFEDICYVCNMSFFSKDEEYRRKIDFENNVMRDFHIY